MSQVILKGLPSTIVDTEINFSNTQNITLINRDAIVETIEFLEDYIYISRRENQSNIEYVEKSDINNLISKYK